MKINISSDLVEVQKCIRRLFHMAKLPYDKLILRRNFRTAKFPKAKLPYGEIFYGEISHGKISYCEIFLAPRQREIESRSGEGKGKKIIRGQTHVSLGAKTIMTSEKKSSPLCD